MSTHNMFLLRNKRYQHFTDEKCALSVAMFFISLGNTCNWTWKDNRSK